MSTTLVKICGLTRVEDVEAAGRAGAGALGFVFAASPRQVSAETASRLVAHVPPGILRVGLFLDQERPEIERVIGTVPLDILQFHGSETEAQCRFYGLPWLKAVAVEDAASVSRAESAYPGAMGLLLDSHTAGRRGGTGKVFDWALSGRSSKPLWLAGGLNAANVAQAIRIVRPFAVDVSSGVESAPGIKDAGRIAKFMEAVRKVDLEGQDNDR